MRFDIRWDFKKRIRNIPDLCDEGCKRSFTCCSNPVDENWLWWSAKIRTRKTTMNRTTDTPRAITLLFVAHGVEKMQTPTKTKKKKNNKNVPTPIIPNTRDELFVTDDTASSVPLLINTISRGCSILLLLTAWSLQNKATFGWNLWFPVPAAAGSSRQHS